MSDLFIAEFKGTYRAPSPEGIRDQNVTKPFHVKIKMKRECLKAPGLNGLFSTYYKEFLRKLYPDMIDTYMYDLVEATELDGTIINNPRALSYENLLKFIAKEQLPINVGLYPPNELRNQVILYQEDPKGQKVLEGKLQALKGNMLAISAELQSLDDVISVVEAEDSEMEDLLATAGGKSRTKKK